MKIDWVDSGSEPQCPPDPAYPAGIDLDVSDGKTPSCFVDLPWPALRIGHYMIECEKCGVRVACTTAGRLDDPRSIRIPCKV